MATAKAMESAVRCQAEALLYFNCNGKDGARGRLHPTLRDETAKDGAPGNDKDGARRDGLHPTLRGETAKDGAPGWLLRGWFCPTHCKERNGWGYLDVAC